MSVRHPSHRKTHVVTQRPPFERIALILQGGGALGAYQAGVYQALAEANLDPNWVAGISIGAINAALIAGNSPEKRIERLREFWETVSAPPFGVPYIAALEASDEFTHSVVNQMSLMERARRRRPGIFSTTRAAAVPLSERGARGPQLLRRRTVARDARAVWWISM